MCPCVLVRWWVMQGDPDAWCHTLSLFKTHTHVHIYTPSGTYVSLNLNPTQMHGLPHSLCCCLSFSIQLSLSPSATLHPASPPFLIPTFLPLLPQMGWVESWLRTFMPKTTCHPSLLLSRMVMLWEVSTVDYGRWCKICSSLLLLLRLSRSYFLSVSDQFKATQSTSSYEMLC